MSGICLGISRSSLAVYYENVVTVEVGVVRHPNDVVTSPFPFSPFEVLKQDIHFKCTFR